MAELFKCRRGQVVSMEGCEGVPGKILLGGFNPTAAIITSPAVSNHANVQFMPSLKESVYVYVFGDNMGSVTISGVAFASKCDGDDSGMTEIFEYYKNYRASQRKEPVEVTFGKESISGFLTASDISSRDPDQLTLDFKFTINTLPEKASG